MAQLIKAAEQEQQQQLKLHCFPNLLFLKDSIPPRLGALEKAFQKVDLCRTDTLNEFSARKKNAIGEVNGKLTPRIKEKTEDTPAIPTICDQVGSNASDSKQLESVLASFQQAICELAHLKQELAANSEKTIFALAMAVARKVVQCEVENNPDLTLATIRKALQKVKNVDKVCVKVNPHDLQKVKNARNSMSEGLSQEMQLFVEADETVSRGGCVIETDMGDFDARLENQLQIIEETFFSSQENILPENQGN